MSYWMMDDPGVERLIEVRHRPDGSEKHIYVRYFRYGPPEARWEIVKENPMKMKTNHGRVGNERLVILTAYLDMSAEDFQVWLYERCGYDPRVPVTPVRPPGDPKGTPNG